MRKQLLIPAVLAAGTVLLSACGSDDSAAEAKQDAPATTASTADGAKPVEGGVNAADDGSGEGAEPVDCGEVTLDPGGAQTLIAAPAAQGVVGCEEAFNVLDEYLAIPLSERGATLDGIEVVNGWSCTTDDGQDISIGCVKGGTGAGDFDLSFYTQPAAG